jgi:hypothetical protein
MTLEEMEKQLHGLNDATKEATATMQKAAARLIEMNADWKEVLRLCRAENQSPADNERIIMQVGVIARKYYNL